MMKALAFAAILVSVGSVAACSSGTEGGGGAADTTTTTSTGPAVDCAAEGDRDMCLSCCDTQNHDGLAVFNEAVVKRCGCEADATCEDNCDTRTAAKDVCLDDGSLAYSALEANDACLACLQGIAAQDPCLEPSLEDCDKDDACAAYQECQDACPKE